MYLLMLLFCASAQAQSLRLHDLIVEAQTNNPEIRAARKAVEAVRWKPGRASSLPETTLSLGYSSNGRPWPGAGLGREPTSNLGFMLSQEFPAPGKRRLAGDIANVEAKAELEQYRQVELRVTARLKLAYYRLGHAHLLRQVIDRSRTLLDRLLRITEVRYTVGKAAQQDILKAQTQLATLETRLVQNDRERAAAAAEISSLLNRPAGSTLEGVPVLPDPPPPAKTLDELMALAGAQAPSIRRDEKMIQRGQLAVNLARKQVYPDYTVSAGYFNMGSMPDMYQARVDFKLPTSWFRKQRAEVAEQTARLTQARHTLQASSQNLTFRIKDEYLLWETSLKLRKLYEQTVVPQAGLALESALVSYEAGTVDFLSVLNNFLTMVEFEMNYHEETMNVHMAITRLEEITGLQLEEHL